MSEDVWIALDEDRSIIGVYLTEAGAEAAVAPSSSMRREWERARANVGKPIPGVGTRVRTADGWITEPQLYEDPGKSPPLSGYVERWTLEP
jgi:hypothetical protein